MDLFVEQIYIFWLINWVCKVIEGQINAVEAGLGGNKVPQGIKKQQQDLFH